MKNYLVQTSGAVPVACDPERTKWKWYLNTSKQHFFACLQCSSKRGQNTGRLVPKLDDKRLQR